MSGARCERRPRSMFRFVRMRSSHARRFVPDVYCRQLRNARAYVSWTRSSASSREPTRRLATRYTWSESSSASSSKRTRSRASVARRRASSGRVSLIRATVPALIWRDQRLRQGPNSAGLAPAQTGQTARMNGYDMVTVDDDKIGTIVGTHGDYLIVESGTLRKSRHAVPTTFAHPLDDDGLVRVSL